MRVERKAWGSGEVVSEERKEKGRGDEEKKREKEKDEKVCENELNLQDV